MRRDGRLKNWLANKAPAGLVEATRRRSGDEYRGPGWLRTAAKLGGKLAQGERLELGRRTRAQKKKKLFFLLFLLIYSFFLFLFFLFLSLLRIAYARWRVKVSPCTLADTLTGTDFSLSDSHWRGFLTFPNFSCSRGSSLSKARILRAVLILSKGLTSPKATQLCATCVFLCIGAEYKGERIGEGKEE